jgi:type II secretory pathway component PulF
MITNEHAIDKLATVSRLLAYQQESGTSSSESLINLRNNLPDDYSNSLDALESLIKGDDLSLVGYAAGPFQVITSILDIVKQESGDIANIFISAQKTIRDTATQARDYWSGFNSLISYLVSVFILASVVLGIFSIKILPQFSETFASFGVPLPALTQTLIANDTALNLTMSSLILLSLVGVLISYHIKKRIALLVPLPHSFKWIPILNRLRSFYSYFLFVKYTDIFLHSSISEEKALAHAKKLAALDVDNLYQLASLFDAAITASRTKSLIKEIDYQGDQVGIFFNRQMILVREALTTGTQLLLGVIIGTLIIAMYLPIFMLGSAI